VRCHPRLILETITITITTNRASKVCKVFSKCQTLNYRASSSHQPTTHPRMSNPFQYQHNNRPYPPHYPCQGVQAWQTYATLHGGYVRIGRGSVNGVGGYQSSGGSQPIPIHNPQNSHHWRPMPQQGLVNGNPPAIYYASRPGGGRQVWNTPPR
jgi:hypothetical protein